MNGYELSRKWFDWCFENPEKINPNHSAMYFFIIEHCNRLGWKDKFGLPTTMVKEAIGIKNFRTYVNTLNDLVEWGFIKMVEKSKNQHSSNIVAIVKNAKATTKALDKAVQKHSQKQCKSKDTIYKQETINLEQITFDQFWELYGKKVGDKKKCNSKWDKLPDFDRQKIIDTLPAFKSKITDKKFQPFPETYLNQRRWDDEIETQQKIDYVLTVSKEDNEW